MHFFENWIIISALLFKDGQQQMPKIIKDAKETIVREARALLATCGATKLNMRALAESAGVAAGTLYNYFPSKEDLIAEVVREDWYTMLEAIDPKLHAVHTATLGLERIFNAIVEYTKIHRELWANIRTSKKFQAKYFDYHKEMLDQICIRVRLLGTRFGFLSDPTVAPFISEVLLAGGMYPDSRFQYLTPCLKILVGEKDF